MKKKLKILYFAIGIIFLLSWSTDKGQDYYLIKIESKNTPYYVHLLCSPEIFSSQKKVNENEDYSFVDYLIKNYNCKFLINRPNDIDMYGCCEFKNTNKGAEALVKGTIDTVLRNKYNDISNALNADSLLKDAPKFKITIDNYEYEAGMVKINCSYCQCNTFAYGFNTTQYIDSVVMLKAVYSLEQVNKEKTGKFIKKINTLPQ